MDFVISCNGLRELNGAYCRNGADVWKGMQLGGWKLHKSDGRWMVTNQSRTIAVRSSVEESDGIPELVTTWERFDDVRYLWTSTVVRIQQIEKCVQISVQNINSPISSTYQQVGYHNGMPQYTSTSNSCVLYYARGSYNSVSCWAVSLHQESGPNCKVREMGLLKSNETAEIPTSPALKWYLPDLHRKQWIESEVSVSLVDADFGSSATLWEHLQRMSEQIHSLQRQQIDVLWLHAPEKLSVSIPSMKALTDIYSVETGPDGEHESRNRLPMWQSKSNAIYCTEDGRWAITTNKYSERDRAVLIATDPHGGKTPYESHKWIDANGVEQEVFITMTDAISPSRDASSFQIDILDSDYGTQLPIVTWNANSEQARCRLHVFSEQHMSSVPDTETLINGILNQSIDLDDIIIQLCNEHRVSPHAWIGVESAAVAEHVLKALLSKAEHQNIFIDRSEIATAVDRLLAGTTTMRDAVREICIRYGMPIDPWTGDFPSGIRLPSVNMMSSNNNSGIVPPAADEVADFMASELGMTQQEVYNHIRSPPQTKTFSSHNHQFGHQNRSVSPTPLPCTSFIRSPVPMSRFISPSQ